MPYSTILFCANLSSLASHREHLSYSFSAISRILPPVSTVFSPSPHIDRRLSPQGLDPLKPFLNFILARSATAPSYNMALIITSIKSNKPNFPITPYIQRLVSLAYTSCFDCCSTTVQCLLVCVSVCVSMFLSVCHYCFFTDCRIHLFSSLAARVFNKLTRYSVCACVRVCVYAAVRAWCTSTDGAAYMGLSVLRGQRRSSSSRSQHRPATFRRRTSLPKHRRDTRRVPPRSNESARYTMPRVHAGPFHSFLCYVVKRK